MAQRDTSKDRWQIEGMIAIKSQMMMKQVESKLLR